MKAILQNVRTGRYFKSPGLWTEDLKEAFRFSDRKTAYEFYLQHYLGDSHNVLEVNADGQVKPGRDS